MVCVSEILPHAIPNQILSRNGGRCAKQSHQALTSALLAVNVKGGIIGMVVIMAVADCVRNSLLW